ncbi:MAG: ABC transporter ATP-binding protein/permease [Oscillospiraceae bacterium]|jgi:putative ABC transport system permease protein|nr:ABC transporter ATP-binding protein/permease [Oscillospiraceae bacterium]
MLQLKDIVKSYEVGGTTVPALRGVSINFRESEFVSILGPSGCGKTTLLNIVGGLDRYTSGDLVINGRTTKDYRDADWDSYRNHSVGFVFQTYNLIPHQTVLANVELALTLSGVSKAERRERARKVIEQVGLADHITKRPNQLSGGQMQRVAIARALINDPDILLADEPTGALDSETSVQVMDLLKEIARGKLVIMVTHNPELADKYSTRIIKLLDGRVLSDTDPVADAEEQPKPDGGKKPSMSFFTALALSLNNLMTKKARTLLTAFAGSIGIIGIALIMSLSNGLQTYIDNVERDTLSSYPLTIQQEAMDLGGLITSLSGDAPEGRERPLDRVYTNNMMAKLMNTAMAKVQTNDLAEFKQHIEDNYETVVKPLVTAISYTYDVDVPLYYEHPEAGLIKVSPNEMFGGMMGGASSGGGFASSMQSPMMSNTEMWRELIPNEQFVADQYEVLAGHMPTAYDEAVLVVSGQNRIPDIMLYSLGLKTQDDFAELQKGIMSGTPINEDEQEFTYEEILGLYYSLILPTDTYEKTGDGWVDRSGDAFFMQQLAMTAPKVKIVGVARPSEDAAAVSSNIYVGYTEQLTEYIVNSINDSAVVKQQREQADKDVFTGIAFEPTETTEFKTMDEVLSYINSLPDPMREQFANAVEQMVDAGMQETQIVSMVNTSLKQQQQQTDATYDGNLTKLGVADLTRPSAINIYPSSFDNKDAIAAFIKEYNDGADEAHKITYTDYIGLLMSSVSTVINAISYILIAFVSISLVVSSIMIGIITYISVLERTREIGVLRSIGARKRDISRVFNAETLIIGFAAGALGIIVTALFCIPANAIIKALTDIPNVAILPVDGAIALVIISMVLTFVAGLIPSRVAANKDPVVALRTE